MTADFNADAENIARGRRAEGQSCVQDWFNGQHLQEIVEEVVGLGQLRQGADRAYRNGTPGRA